MLTNCLSAFPASCMYRQCKRYFRFLNSVARNQYENKWEVFFFAKNLAPPEPGLCGRLTVQCVLFYLRTCLCRLDVLQLCVFIPIYSGILSPTCSVHDVHTSRLCIHVCCCYTFRCMFPVLHTSQPRSHGRGWVYTGGYFLIFFFFFLPPRPSSCGACLPPVVRASLLRRSLSLVNER